jgi:hypothetical protein
MHFNQSLQGESDVLFDKISKNLLRYATAVLFFMQFENLHFIYIDSRWCTNLLQDSLLLSPENRSLR